MKCNYSVSNTQKVNENGRRKLTILTVAFLIWCLWGNRPSQVNMGEYNLVHSLQNQTFGIKTLLG